MFFTAIIPIIIAICIGYLIYLKGEVEWSCYLPCVVLNFILPENIFKNYNDVINIRKMIDDSSTYLDQGPDNFSYINTYYIPNYNNNLNDKLLLRIYNYNIDILESDNNNNNNETDNNNDSNYLNDEKTDKNIRNNSNNNNNHNKYKLKKVLIIFFPGAWILGSIESIHGICRYFASFTDFIVVSVQYRLAPEYAYPHAFYDAYDALQWIKQNIYKYGGDSKHIFISGDDCNDNDDGDRDDIYIGNLSDMYVAFI